MKELYSLLSIFALFVIPLWLILHYRNAARRVESELPREAHEQLEQLEARIDGYRKRIESLESILDEHHPQWRESKS